MTTAARRVAAQIGTRYGAYLITFRETSAGDGDSTPDVLFDCAGSIRRARQVAREGAEGLGWSGPWRWITGEEAQPWTAILEAVDDEDREER